MAYKEMNSVNGMKLGKYVAFESEVTLSAAGDSDWILVPPNVKKLSVSVSFAGGGQGKVQTTTDLLTTVKTGSPVAIDWPKGIVSASTQVAAEPVTAIRLTQTSVGGTSKMTVRAQ